MPSRGQAFISMRKHENGRKSGEVNRKGERVLSLCGRLRTKNKKKAEVGNQEGRGIETSGGTQESTKEERICKKCKKRVKNQDARGRLVNNLGTYSKKGRDAWAYRGGRGKKKISPEKTSPIEMGERGGGGVSTMSEKATSGGIPPSEKVCHVGHARNTFKCYLKKKKDNDGVANRDQKEQKD